MKRLAAHDFEDIWQVFSGCHFLYSTCWLLSIASVPFRSSKGFSPLTMMRPYSLYCINFHSGMLLPNFRFTRSPQSIFSKKRSRRYLRSCASFETTPALLSTLSNYPRRKQPVTVGWLNNLQRMVPFQDQTGRRQRGLIWVRINFMRWETMREPSGSSVLRILSALKLYVFFSSPY